MKRIYDRFSICHNEENNSDKLLLFYHDRLVLAIDIRPLMEDLLSMRGWTKE